MGTKVDPKAAASKIFPPGQACLSAAQCGGGEIRIGGTPCSEQTYVGMSINGGTSLFQETLIYEDVFLIWIWVQPLVPCCL